jgi:hypothetical protein
LAIHVDEQELKRKRNRLAQRKHRQRESTRNASQGPVSQKPTGKKKQFSSFTFANEEGDGELP